MSMQGNTFYNLEYLGQLSDQERKIGGSQLHVNVDLQKLN